MLFKKEDLALNEAMSILENAEYLSEDECLLDPNTIPVFENARLDMHIVTYNDMVKLSESYGLDADECLQCVAETNQIDPSTIAVAIDEADSIVDPDIVTDFPQVVINPISEESLAYKFCEACVDAYAETADEDYLWFAIDESYLLEADKAPETKEKKESLVNRIKGAGKAVLNQIKDTKEKVVGGKRMVGQGPESFHPGDDPNTVYGQRNVPGAVGRFRSEYKNTEGGTWNKVKAGAKAGVAGLNKKDAAVIGGAAVGVAGAAAIATKILKASNNKPKSWIGKKIASLRSLYSKWLRRANMEKNLRRASAIKKVCATIMNVIDKLMAKLQNAAG